EQETPMFCRLTDNDSARTGASLAAVGFGFVSLLAASTKDVSAQAAGPSDPTQSHSWAAGAISHARQMMRFKDTGNGSQQTPGVIPVLSIARDPTGLISTYQPGGRTDTAGNAFFQNLGTNGRTCFTCHQPQTGWTISAASVRARFDESAGADPLFRL